MATVFARDSEVATAVVGSTSAVNWASVFAGAAVAIATTLILVALGSGLGFAAASPWPGSAPTPTTFAIGIGIWLIVTQWLSSALGGYITGRLRTRWTGIHTHEVVFRDTAHGLLAWAISTAVVCAVALATASSGAGATTSAATVALNNATDTLLRTSNPKEGANAAIQAQVSRLLAQGGDLRADDRSYLASEVQAQTGLSASEAQQRVATALASVREAADKARKAASALGFFTALSMLIGAFIASTAAAYAGNLRDTNADMTAPL